MSNWKKLHWGDIATLEYGRSLRGYESNGGKFPVYGTNGAIGKHSEPLCQHPGVIVGRKGAYRGIHYSESPFFVIDTAFYLEPKIDLDLKWAYYKLLTYDINGMDSGSAIPSTSRDAFYSLPVDVPPFEEQRRIAAILTVLDDKIELNRQMNETLEAMARTTFRSWFVDFDPVRAKMEGRQPAGMDAAIAALFPDSFQDSALGEIPKGWQVRSLPDVIEVNPSRRLAKDEPAPYVDMQNMPFRGHRVLGWIDRSPGSGAKFMNGDTLLARITPCLENGKTAYVDFLSDGTIGWGSTEYIVLHPKSPLPGYFGYCLARSDEFRNHAILNMSGTSGRQRVPPECFDQYQIIVPPEPVAIAFGYIVNPWVQMIKTDDEECRTLTAIRDALLPKLMAGEIQSV